MRRCSDAGETVLHLIESIESAMNYELAAAPNRIDMALHAENIIDAYAATEVDKLTTPSDLFACCQAHNQVTLHVTDGLSTTSPLWASRGGW